MITKVEKVLELEYDESVALAVIEDNQDLKEIFQDDVKISFNMLYTLSKEEKLNEETKEIIKNIFDKIILTSKPLINKYLLFGEKENKFFGKVETPVQETEYVEEVDEVEEAIEEPKKEVNTATKKPKKEKALPRRYGKASILKDIEKQGGKATNSQLTALAVNDLKNVYVNLNSRLINDMLTTNPKLTDEDYRDIRSAINIVKTKLKDILKK
jgi:hypothetical protein